MKTLDKFQGSLVGLAIGDALGYPTEFRGYARILECFGPDGVTDFVSIKDPRWGDRPIIVGADQAPGTFSDDTQMTVALAHGLLEAGPSASLDVQMKAIGRHFVTWSRSEKNNRAPGNTCMTGCANLEAGKPWRQAGVLQSKGCGSAMRVAPIGLCFADDMDRLLEVSRASSILTHGHDAAIEGAAGAALLVALAMQNTPPEQMYEALMDTCAPASQDFKTCLKLLPQVLDLPPQTAMSNYGLGESWVAEQAVVSALYCVYKSPDDFGKAVLMAANTDGDSDSIACIAGSILGARLGLEQIKASWRIQVEDSAQLHALGAQLFDMFG